MKKQYLQNDKLDGVAGKLLKAARLPDEEIDRIVEAPHLFDSVKAAIDDGKVQRKPRGFFNGRPNLLAWNWQKATVSFAVFAVLTAGALGLINFANQYYLSSDVAAKIQSQILPVDFPEETSGKQDFSDVENRMSVQRSGSENAKAIKTHMAKGRRADREELSEFYPLTYTDDPESDVDGGQIVRVELPRSSLVAMGVDLPSENGMDKVKTDLLISSDGVMKAVRFVK
jgi:hypothetical protein